MKSCRLLKLEQNLGIHVHMHSTAGVSDMCIKTLLSITPSTIESSCDLCMISCRTKVVLYFVKYD